MLVKTIVLHDIARAKPKSHNFTAPPRPTKVCKDVPKVWNAPCMGVTTVTKLFRVQSCMLPHREAAPPPFCHFCLASAGYNDRVSWRQNGTT